MITVVIADDHNLVRQGIRALVEKAPDIEILAEASDGHQAIEACSRLRPDVLLTDIVMPGVNGIQVVEHLKTFNVPSRVVVLSMHSDETLIRQALSKGARGYVLKQALAEELLIAIRAAARGDTYLSPQVSSLLVEYSLQGKNLMTETDAFDKLSLREREVLQMLAEGHTNLEIARALVLSEKTIEKHRATLMEKLAVRNLAGLVRIAIKNGLIPLND